VTSELDLLDSRVPRCSWSLILWQVISAVMCSWVWSERLEAEVQDGLWTFTICMASYNPLSTIQNALNRQNYHAVMWELNETYAW